jgi:hypothetical protein
MQAGRGTTRRQLEWLIIHNRLQYIADVLCSSENFVLAHDLASDPDLPIAAPPVLLRWAQAVIDTLGTDSAACLAWLRQRLDGTLGVDWATVAGYALVRLLLFHLSTLNCSRYRVPCAACGYKRPREWSYFCCTMVHFLSLLLCGLLCLCIEAYAVKLFCAVSSSSRYVAMLCGRG